MSPASGDFGRMMALQFFLNRFHSINVPSEWGRYKNHLLNKVKWVVSCYLVSIQLMSPASGDEYLCYENAEKTEFPFN